MREFKKVPRGKKDKRPTKNAYLVHMIAGRKAENKEANRLDVHVTLMIT